jgi:glycosyltransferase involved in cell wall biosynthesis
MGSGGAERQLSYLAQALAQRGHDIHLGLRDGGPNEQQIDTRSVQIHRLGHHGHHDPRFASDVFRLMLHLQPDVVQTWLTQMDVLGGLAAIVAGCPWVLSERASALAYPSSMKNAFRAVLARRANMIVANSNAGLEYWQSLPRRVKRAVVLNGLPVEEIDLAVPLVGSEVPGADLPMLLHVGRLAPQKNIFTLIRAFGRARRPAKLLLVGEGPQQRETSALIAQLGLEDRVFMLGLHDRVWGLMKGASAVISISHFEGQPNALLEAMACRCPIIASEIPSHREILGDTTALMVNGTDLDSIASAIDQVNLDRVSAARRAEVARALVESRTFAGCAGEYERLYESVRKRTSRRVAAPYRGTVLQAAGKSTLTASRDDAATTGSTGTREQP